MINASGSTTETGGVEARRGFRYQDHAAARLLLETLLQDSDAEIWLELRSDTTVVRSNGTTNSREYVEVKSSTADRLWSVAAICTRKVKDGDHIAGTSLVEKSLASDDEVADPRPLFRLITLRDCNLELAVLKLDRMHAGRTADRIEPILQDVHDRLGDCNSPAGRDLRHWCYNVFWDVHDDQAIQDANRLMLHELAERRGYLLRGRQITNAYESLVGRLATIAALREESERIMNTDLIIENVELSLSEAFPYLGEQAENRLRTKLEAAGIPETLIRAAEERRRAYSNAIYRPQYSAEPSEHFFEEVNARLSLLLGKFLDDSSQDHTGAQFHIECMKEVERYWSSLPESKRPGLSLALGCMYETTNRCSHRFTHEEVV